MKLESSKNTKHTLTIKKAPIKMKILAHHLSWYSILGLIPKYPNCHLYMCLRNSNGQSKKLVLEASIPIALDRSTQLSIRYHPIILFFWKHPCGRLLSAI